MKNEYVRVTAVAHQVLGDIGGGAPFALDYGTDELMPSGSGVPSEATQCVGIPESIS